MHRSEQRPVRRRVHELCYEIDSVVCQEGGMVLKKVEKRLYALEAEHLRDRVLSSVEFLLKLLFLPALCLVPCCLAHPSTVARGQ
jgi:hypothetical protein